MEIFSSISMIDRNKIFFSKPFSGFHVGDIVSVIGPKVDKLFITDLKILECSSDFVHIDRNLGFDKATFTDYIIVLKNRDYEKDNSNKGMIDHLIHSESCGSKESIKFLELCFAPEILSPEESC